MQKFFNDSIETINNGFRICNQMMTTMKKICILFLFLSLPVVEGFAQQQPAEEDPFKRDPIFNQSIDELLGRKDKNQQQEEETDDRSPNRNISSDRVVRKVARTGIDLGGSLEAGPYYSNALYSQYPNLPMIHYNRVNGLFLGIRSERMQWHRYGSFLNIPQIEPHGFIGYGTASKEWEYAIGLEKRIGENQRFMIGGEYHRATATEDFKRVGLIESSLTAFFAGYDYLDYYKMEGFGFYSVLRTERWLEAAFSYNRDTFTTVEQNTDYTMFGKSSVFRPNPALDEFADEIDLDIYSVSLSLNPRDALIYNNFSISGTVVAEFADNGASDENYRFNRYQSEMKLFYNFEPGSVFRWKLQGGGITGNAPDFKNFFLGGIGSLRGSPFKFFSGNQMLASNIEVQFGRPSNRTGEWFRDYHLHLLLFLDSGWAADIEGMESAKNPFEGFKEFEFSSLQHDFGIGIGTGAVRAELAWPLKTFDSSPVFWIRFNPTF